MPSYFYKMKAIYIQSYNWAGRIIKEKVEQGSEKPMAVVLDIDETVLKLCPVPWDLPIWLQNWGLMFIIFQTGENQVRHAALIKEML